MSFTLSKDVNPPTVFLARLSELTDRIDPEMALFRRKVHQFKYPVQKLRNFFSEPPQYGAGERGLDRESVGQPRYVRITDIDEYGILPDELGATAATVEARYLLEEDDLLLARSGNTVGKSYLHKSAHVSYPCFYAGYLIRFRFNQNKLLPDYVFALTQLPYYKAWVQAIQRAAGQPNINAQEYSNFEIPTPPPSIQMEIVSLLQKAYAEKRRQDAEAKNMLQGIDELLLDELGIKLKPELPSTVEDRSFRRAFSSVTGARLDPTANQPKRYEIETAAGAGKYQPQPLRRLVNWVKNIVDSMSSQDPYVGLENIDGETGAFLGDGDKETIGSAFRFSAGQILFPKLRPYLNKTHLASFSGICSTEFHVFDAHGVRADFLVEVLRCRLLVSLTSLLMTGNTLPRLQVADIERLLIPVPPAPIQAKICQRIAELRQKALALRTEAVTELEQSKRMIEATILGKEVGA